MKKLMFVLLLFIFMPQSVQAASCYRAKEAEAEQGIKILSELMVIGLNCQHMASANGKNLYVAYNEFTRRNANLFGGYEEILMNYFRKNGRNADASIHKLRTDFANKISKDAADMRPDIFCARYSPRIIQAQAMSRDDIRKWAATIYPSHPVSKPLCDQ
ncbi:MAG: hypothetical protein CMH27_09355 [Micavibrio sp.]|nr:hypothetical protein [Micavibrio sp.]|tara:strand:- start:785 stop:1261 length:477 start_codon:yes stop_codon:yes gene_type:complete